MIALLLSGIFAVSQPLPMQKVVSYHDRLYEMCEGKAGMKCCRASVRAMRSEQARLYDETQGCPDGTQRMSLSCPASHNWCSHKTVEEVRGGEMRGDSLR